MREIGEPACGDGFRIEVEGVAERAARANDNDLVVEQATALAAELKLMSRLDTTLPVTAGCGVGVDVEQIRPLPDLNRMAARLFAPKYFVRIEIFNFTRKFNA